MVEPEEDAISKSGTELLGNERNRERIYARELIERPAGVVSRKSRLANLRRDEFRADLTSTRRWGEMRWC